MSDQYVIDPSRDEIITIKAATKLPHFRIDGRSPHFGLGWRLIRYGKKAANGATVFLPTIMTTRGTCTSREAVDWFFARLNGKPAPHNSKAAESAIDVAERELVAAGFVTA